VINGDHFQFATSGIAAIAGYAIVNVPMGKVFGLPVGISFIGTAFSEPTLIKLTSGFEHAVHARLVPQLFDTLPLDNVSGVPLIRVAAGTSARRNTGAITACNGDRERRNGPSCSAAPRLRWSLHAAVFVTGSRLVARPCSGRSLRARRGSRTTR